MRYTHARGQQTKNPRQRLFIGLFCVILLLFGYYGITSFSKDTPTPLAETAPAHTTLVEDMQLVWPAVGQAAIGSVEDGLIARSSDKEKVRPIASMSKVITALAIMEKQPFELGDDGQTYTITVDDIASMSEYIAQEGSVEPLLIGMELTQYQAMQRMLIASDNNIADILVERIFGSQEAYVSYANNMLKHMGLSQTVVTDASGFSPKTVSTPSEMVMIGIAVLKNPVIAKIVAQSQTRMSIGQKDLVLTNTNQLLGTDGVIGIKTGITNEAGGCLLFAARYADQDGQEVTIVGVVMGSRNAGSRFNDSRKLLVSVRQGFNLAETKSLNDVEIQPADNTMVLPPRLRDRAQR